MELQWGRDREVADSHVREIEPALFVHGFNGAATVRSRIEQGEPHYHLVLPVPLQWGRDREVADSATSPRT